MEKIFGSFKRMHESEWFDQHLIRKNWELYNVFENHGQANWGALITRTIAQLTGTNSFRAGSRMDVYAQVGANNTTTLAQVLPPAGSDQNWGCLVDDLPIDLLM